VGRSRRVLGRGLDALIPSQPREWLREVPLDRIEPNSEQPRRRFPEEALAELAESIRMHGVLQPLVVSTTDAGGYRLIVGERRWQAAKLAGLESVPVIERETTPRSALELALIENLQRQDLDPLEEAAAFERLMSEYGLTQEEVAGRVGRSRPAVANTLRLLNLPSSLKQALLNGEVSEGHARALLGLADPLVQEAALQRVRERQLTVRQTEALVNELRHRETAAPDNRTPRAQELEVLEGRLRESLGRKVSIQKGRRAGRIVIEYYSPEDLDTLLEHLLSASSS